MTRSALREILIILAAALVGAAAFAFAPSGWPYLRLINLGLSLTLGITLMARVRSLVRLDQRYLFAPEIWFRAATTIFFAFGNAVPYLVSEATVRRIRRNYDFSDLELVKLNLVTLVGVAVVLSMLAFSAKPVRQLIVAIVPIFRTRGTLGELRVVTIVFLVVGGLFRYGVIISFVFSAGDSVVPGILRNLAYLYYAGLFLLVLLVLQSKGRFAAIAAGLVFVEIVASVATFYKSEVMLTCIFVWLAFLLHRTTTLRVVGGLAALVAIFLTLVPLIDYGRLLVLSRYGNIEGGTLGDRIEFMTRYYESDVKLYRDRQEQVERAMRRLSYVNIGTFTLDRYDEGHPGDTYADIGIVLIPRALWPEKPIVSDQGKELTYLFEGYTESSSSQGLFGEAYWNYGWPGVIFGMAFYGFLMSILSQLSLLILRQQLWVFLPVVLAGVRWGGRVDGLMTVDVVGLFAISGVLFVFLVFGHLLMRTVTRRQIAPPGLPA